MEVASSKITSMAAFNYSEIEQFVENMASTYGMFFTAFRQQLI